MTALKKRHASRMAFMVALSMTLVMPPAICQETQPVAGARQIIIQNQNGDRLVSRSLFGSTQAVTGRAQPAARDPAVTGKLERQWLFKLPTSMPTTTARVEDEEEKEDSGAYDRLAATQFAPAIEEELAPGGKRDIALDVAASSVLLGSVQWIGTNDPLQLTLSLDGAKLATGRAPARGSDNRGRITVTTFAAAAGRATLSVTNTTTNTARVQLVLGALPQ